MAILKKTYGDPNSNGAFSIIQSLDGGYAIAAWKSYGESYDGWIIKTNGIGDIQWEKTYGGTNYNYVYSIIQSFDGGYAIVGWTFSKVSQSNYAWIIKVNSIGDLLWEKTYGGNTNNFALSIIQSLDGGYTIAGKTASKGSGSYDAWIIKLNSIGDLLWDKTYGGANEGDAYSIIQSLDGGYTIAGSTYSKGNGLCDAWIIKTNGIGDLQWDKTYGGTNGDVAYSMIQSLDGGYTIAGYTSSKGSGSGDAFIIKTNGIGDLQWDKTYGGANNDVAYSIIQSLDGGYAVAGGKTSKGSGLIDAWIIKTNGIGDLQWEKTYGGANGGIAYSIIQSHDGGYAVAGWTCSKDRECYAWITKMNN